MLPLWSTLMDLVGLLSSMMYGTRPDMKSRMEANTYILPKTLSFLGGERSDVRFIHLD